MDVTYVTGTVDDEYQYLLTLRLAARSYKY